MTPGELGFDTTDGVFPRGVFRPRWGMRETRRLVISLVLTILPSRQFVDLVWFKTGFVKTELLTNQPAVAVYAFGVCLLLEMMAVVWLLVAVLGWRRLWIQRCVAVLGDWGWSLQANEDILDGLLSQQPPAVVTVTDSDDRAVTVRFPGLRVQRTKAGGWYLDPGDRIQVTGYSLTELALANARTRVARP